MMKNIIEKEERESSVLECFPFRSKSANMAMRSTGSGFDFKAGGKSGAGSILTFTMFFFPNFPLAVRPYGWLRRPPWGPDTAGPISQAVISPSFPVLKAPSPPVPGLILWWLDVDLLDFLQESFISLLTVAFSHLHPLMRAPWHRLK